MGRKIIKWTSISILGLVVATFFVFTASVHRADNEPIEALDREFTMVNGNYHVETMNPMAQVVIYPGALVEPRAYLPLAQKISNMGFDVYVMRMPFHFAILNPGVIDELDLDDGLPIYIGGHSLGGVAAAKQVDNYPDRYDGLFLLASYPQESVDLSNWDKPVLSITASEDGVMDQEAYEDAMIRLPDHTRTLEVTGGNHANFAAYGPQRNDGEAMLKRSVQESIVATRIGFLILTHLE